MKNHLVKPFQNMRNIGIFFPIFYFCLFLEIKLSEMSVIPSETAIFLSKLISQTFSHCSLVFLQDRFDNSEIFDYIVENTNLNYYSIRYNYSVTSEYPLKYMPSNLNFTQNFPMEFRISLANFNRRTDRCKVILMMISDLQPELMKQINTLISPVFIPFAQKDTDYFIFVTKPKLVDQLLLMPEFPAKIKYKIAISDQESHASKEDLVIKSVCFFCGEDASPEIIEFPNTGIVDYFPDFVQNLNGKVLKISCPLVKSGIEMLRPSWDKVENTKRGIWKHLLEDFLMVKFNFTYKMFLSSGGGGTGLELPNGTWIGVIGDVISGEADIGIITGATASRIRLVDFTNSFFITSYLGFFTSQGKREYSTKALFRTFAPLMWLCIFITGVFGFLFFKFLIKMGLQYGNPKDNFRRKGVQFKADWGLQNEIFFFFRTYISRNTAMPRFQPLRCFVALWLFFTLILKSVYRSKLVGLLAVPSVEKLPQDFGELVRSDYEVGIIKRGDALFNSLRASEDPVYKKLLTKMEIITGIGLECLEKVVTRKYACIAYDFEMKYLNARNLSDSDMRKLVLAPTTTFNVWMGLTTEGGSIYKSNFDKWLRNIRSFNLEKIWFERDMYYTVRLPKRAWWLETNQTSKLKRMNTKKKSNLTMKNIAGAFYLLLVSLFLAFNVLLFDLVRFYMLPKIRLNPFR